MTRTGSQPHEPRRGRSSGRMGMVALCAGIAVAVATGGALFAEPQAAAPAAAPPPPAAVDTAPGRAAFLKQYCASCHSARLKSGGLVLEGKDAADIAGDPDTWEKVVRRVSAGEMPPPVAPRRPDAATAHAFAAGLLAELDAAARKRTYAGPALVRRLNRTEYGNAVRDLFGIDFPYAAELPADGVANGFDNIADALAMSPVQLESYLKVGRKVTELAVGVSDPVPSSDVIAVTDPQDAWLAGAPFGTRGGVVARRVVPRVGEYEIRAVLNNDRLAAVEGQRLFRVRTPLQPGTHRFVAAFPQENGIRMGPVPNLGGPGGDPMAGPVDLRGSAVRPTIAFFVDGKPIKTLEISGPGAGDAALGVPSGPPILVRMEIAGPYNAGPVVASESRRRIFVCHPARAAEERPCAQRILGAFGRRAFRRDVTREDLRPYLASYDRGRAAGDFDTAVAGAVRDMLVAVDFLYRLELDPPGAKPGSVRPLTDDELASRLSFFLWSSLPDDQLLDAAKHGKLRSKFGRAAEVRRMLADKRADALVDNFAAQWLGLRAIEQAQPDPKVYPEFDEGLRRDFAEETRLFLRSVMRENRSINDVLSARYTFVNERLAGLYGISGVEGPAFRRVQLADNSPRGGVLGHGSILMATSHTKKTSPVLRGKWVLDNLLNAPPPPPPPGVPPLDESPGAGGKKLTTREQVERHRASPVCSSCHSRMDPFGFALENFDVLGKWRTADDGGPIDPTSSLPGGRRLSGIGDLRTALLDDPHRFVGATVARLMTYAIGRPLGGRDQPAVRQIVASTAPQGYRFDDLVLGVVESPEFRLREVEARQ